MLATRYNVLTMVDERSARAGTAGGLQEPALPPGRELTLREGRTVFFRDVGPRKAPVLMLLHGLGATADLNWFPAYPVLSENFRVVAMDLRGHGRGTSPNEPFRLEDCADDAAALAVRLGISKFVAVGYSLGGVVAQLLWQRHRTMVEGLVLCATSRNFRGDPRERVLFTLYPAATFFVRAATPEVAHGVGHFLRAPGARTEWSEWIRQQIRFSSPRAIMQAASALARFTSHDWAPRIDVPTAVVCTMRDKLITPRRQRKLAEAIPGAERFDVDGDHFVCTEHPERFLPALEDACRSVVRRDGGVRRIAS